MSKRPSRKIIGSEHYRLCVFRVLKQFPNGTPRLIVRCPEEATIVLDDDVAKNEFVIGYISERMLTPKDERPSP